MRENFLDKSQFENFNLGDSKENEIRTQERNSEIIEKEKGLFSKFGDKLVELGRKFKDKPKKLSKAVALMLLLRAGTAFAEANMERPGMRDTSEPQRLGEILDASPQFNWKKFIKNVEISYGMEEKSNDKDDFEVAEGVWGDFYEKMDTDEYNGIKKIFDESIQNLNSVKEYFDVLEKGSEKFNDLQKLHYIQRIGKALGSTYNYDMLDDKDSVKVSDDDMFKSLKSYFADETIESGICGNIHTFMAKIARKMGIESWTQNDMTEEGGHIFMGGMAELDGNKQIVFCDYDDVIPTNTLNYQKALGVAERYHRSVTMFQSIVSNPDSTGMFIKSLATEKMEEAAGIVEPERRFDDLMGENEIQDNEGLKIELTNETKKIEFSKDSIGLSFYDYRNSGNPYNSLESLQSAKLGFNDKDFEANLSVLHLNINDLNNKTLSQTEIIGEVFGSYLKNIKLNKGEYEKLKLKLGATIDNVIGYSLESKQFDVKGEFGAGAQLVYVDPSEAGKFWVGAEIVGRYQKSDMQKQDLIVQNTLQRFKAGGEVEVQEGIIANLEGSYGKVPWGDKIGLKAGGKINNLKIEAAVEKQRSEQKRFFPDQEKISAEIGYKTPIGEIDIYGALETEEYKDAKEEKKWEAGLKYRIVLWE